MDNNLTESVEKVDENTIKSTKTETIVTENTFTYDYLTSQKIAIQSQKDSDNAKRDAELAEINELLAQCDALQVKPKLIDPIVD
jgi:hypothetical protein